MFTYPLNLKFDSVDYPRNMQDTRVEAAHSRCDLGAQPLAESGALIGVRQAAAARRLTAAGVMGSSCLAKWPTRTWIEPGQSAWALQTDGFVLPLPAPSSGGGARLPANLRR